MTSFAPENELIRLERWFTAHAARMRERREREQAEAQAAAQARDERSRTPGRPKASS